MYIFILFSFKVILTKSSSSEVSLSSLGFRQYCGPKRKEYLTYEVRLKSFKHWPEKVTQTPEELAEAGFYYCGRKLLNSFFICKLCLICYTGPIDFYI